MMTNITPVVEAVLALLAAVVSCFLVPYIKSKYGAQKLAEIQKWVRIAVEAAEQIFKESGLGEQKKAYVLEFLSSKGFTLDADSVDKMIEAAVLALNGKSAGD